MVLDVVQPSLSFYNQFILSRKAHEQYLHMEAEINGDQTDHDQVSVVEVDEAVGMEDVSTPVVVVLVLLQIEINKFCKGKFEGNQLPNSSHKKDDTM